MKIKNAKQTIAAFEAQEIKTAQQLEVKGGNAAVVAREFIGDDDVVYI